MGYEQEGSLADLFPEDFVDDVARETTRRVGAELHRRVVERTPIAEVPPVYGTDDQSFADFTADRGGRVPGTARRSWRTTEAAVDPQTGNWSITEYTDDEVMPYIEDDTRPHTIRPKVIWKVDAHGRRYRAMLRFPSGGVFRFAHEVHHPGTTGQHMMRDGLAAIEAGWGGIAQRVLEERSARER